MVERIIFLIVLRGSLSVQQCISRLPARNAGGIGKEWQVSPLSFVRERAFKAIGMTNMQSIFDLHRLLTDMAAS